MSSTTVEDTPSTDLRASVMDELRQLDAGPPEDEYAGILHELPPAYNTFEMAYEHWCKTDKAKHDMVALDPAFRAAEAELKEAKQVLKQRQATSKELFQKSRLKRNSFMSYLGFGKSNRKTHIESSPASSHSPSEGDSPAAEAFKRTHEVEVKQSLLVDDLAAKVDEFKRKRQTLSDTASSSNLSWNQLRRIAEETLSGRADLAVTLGEATERLEGAENAYNVAKKTAADLIRARLAVQHAHHYFTLTLKICDEVRGTATNRALVGALGGGDGINEMTKKIQYGNSVKMATKAQVCLDETFRVMESHVHMLPADRLEDYNALKKLGLMQMSKIYNLLWGGSMLVGGISGSTKLMLERQEAAFAHLTHLAVWIQNHAPVCSTEEDLAEKSRDNVRREVAAAWDESISSCG